jgi:hypothetical protein
LHGCIEHFFFGHLILEVFPLLLQPLEVRNQLPWVPFFCLLTYDQFSWVSSL